jgi:CheY-like chemotaxis protein
MRHRVLVADDNRDTAETFATLIRMAGHDAYVAFDGASALILAETHAIDVAVLDLEMPKLNGYEVARRLRARSVDQPLFMIAVTGWTRESERAAARAAGFNAFLTKPLEFDQLEQLLRSPPVNPADRTR